MTYEGQVLPILRKGHPGLEVVAQSVEVMTTENDGALLCSPETHKMIKDIEATLLNTGTAVGLAATQVNIPYRIIIFRIPKDRSDDGVEVPLTVAVNPVIHSYEGDMVGGWEGCLSLPGMLGWVPRSQTIEYSFFDPVKGEMVSRRRVHGFHARLVQHELDHLDGITYVQRMKDMKLFGYVEEMKQYKVNHEKDIVDED